MRIRIPATTANMGPGFDCIGMALELYNYIDFEVLDDNRVELSVEGDADIALDEDNLIYQTYKRTFQYVGQEPRGIKMHFTNNIPFARGLGSSSAAIIGGIFVANQVMGGCLSNQEMLKVALEFEGHPDNIAPALLGGIIISTLIDGEVVYKKITPPSQLVSTVIIPDYELSTEAARSVLPREMSMEDGVFNVARVAFLVAALSSGELSDLTVGIEDRIHQPYRMSLIKGIDEIKQVAKEQGALGVAISGAGPTIIIFDQEKDKNYLEIESLLKPQGVNVEIKQLCPVNQGASEVVLSIYR